MSNANGRSSKQKNGLKDKLIRRDGRTCHYCPVTMRRGGPLNGNLMTIEHIVPIADGGTWALSNLVLACYDCNHERASKPSPCDCNRCSNALFFHNNFFI